MYLSDQLNLSLYGHDLLKKGADERIFANKEGRLQYGIRPVNIDLINRGSCTCSSATEDDLSLITYLLEKNTTPDDWIEQLEQNTGELKNIFITDNKADFEVFYAPSGTDLTYYTLLFGLLIYPDRPILNVVTCIEELGSGSRLASAGKFFSRYNQFGELINQKPPISTGKVLPVFLNARSSQGKILDHKKNIKALIDQHPGHTVIVNLVCGSKSGIEDDLSIIDEIPKENVLINVDFCQFRHREELISSLLKKGVMAMITGSKFFQAPPFCGALLVPKWITSRLKRATRLKVTYPFKPFFSRYDVPWSVREQFGFKDKINVSSILRWSCAIEEIKRYFSLPKRVAQEIIYQWYEFMLNEIKKYDEFELIPDQDKTLNSIVSFRVRCKNGYLNHQQLKELHYAISTRNYTNQQNFKNIFIGQPVSFGNQSFLRMAIGAQNIREFLEADNDPFVEDKAILSIIQSTLIQNYAS